MITPFENVVPMGLDGRGIVILGAGGGGIGTATARTLAAAGAKLLCVDIDEQQAQAVAKEVGGHAFQADITDRKQMEDLFANAGRLFGDSLHGIADIVGWAPGGPLDGADDQAIARAFDLNLRHALLTVQIAAPMLARGGGGSMVFVSSLSGSKATPGQGLYSMFKGGLEQLIRQAAFEYGPGGVRVNGVAPGLTVTPGVEMAMTSEFTRRVEATIPMRKLATPQDQANSIFFLLSDLASHVSGSIIHVDGGQMTGANLPQLGGD